MTVLTECLTRSSREKPCTSLSSGLVWLASVFIDPEISRTHMIAHGFLLLFFGSDGGITLTLTNT
jgi:hypothetical protein